MNNFTFENPTRVFFGRGCVREHLPGLLADSHTILLGYGGGSIVRNGIYDEVMEILTDAGKTVVEFPGIMPNPTYAKVQEGVSLVKEHGVDLILAVGGGSVMDCCKAVSMGSVYEGDLWEDFWAKAGVVDFTPLPLDVIVTVPGTGSEVNGDAVITNEEQKVKTGRDYIGCNARFALLDPTYTLSVPRRQMLAGGFDMLSHVMETYFSGPDEENISDDISEALMRGIIRDLRAAARDPQNYEARSNLMWASSMAEIRLIKLGKKCDFECHQIEHQLGAYTDCIHGEGLAVLHPVYYQHILRDGQRKFARFAVRVWDLDPAGKTEEEMALAGVTALADFIRELGLPMTLRELGVDTSLDLAAVAESCILNTGGYRVMTHEEILEILRECF